MWILLLFSSIRASLISKQRLINHPPTKMCLLNISACSPYYSSNRNLSKVILNKFMINKLQWVLTVVHISAVKSLGPSLEEIRFLWIINKYIYISMLKWNFLQNIKDALSFLSRNIRSVKNCLFRFNLAFIPQPPWPWTRTTQLIIFKKNYDKQTNAWIKNVRLLCSFIDDF